MKKLAWAAVLVWLASTALRADQKSSDLKFVVVKADTGKPVRNAAVVLHPVNKDGRQSSGGIELKTDPEGKASVSGIPLGKLRVQVLMRGFQTYGEDLDITDAKHEITIKLKRPQRQYSIYDDKPKQDEKKPKE